MPPKRSRVRFACGAASSFLILIAVLTGIAFVILRVGVGGEALTARAQLALKSALGPDVR